MARYFRTKEDWLEYNGFNQDGYTYAVTGDNTYAIKDKLKELGCRYSPLFKWHSPELIQNLPEGYTQIEFNFDDYAEWEEPLQNVRYFENAEENAEARFIAAKGPSLSEFLDGEIGERVRNLTVVLKSCHGFYGRYGYTHILTFQHGENLITWFTTSNITAEEGKTYDFTGTIKSFDIYKGEKTTRVTRVKLVEIM